MDQVRSNTDMNYGANRQDQARDQEWHQMYRLVLPSHRSDLWRWRKYLEGEHWPGVRANEGREGGEEKAKERSKERAEV